MPIKSPGYFLCMYVWFQREAECMIVCACASVCVCVCVNSEWHKELVIWEDPHDNTFTIVLWYPGVAQDPIYLPYAVT